MPYRAPEELKKHPEAIEPAGNKLLGERTFHAYYVRVYCCSWPVFKLQPKAETRRSSTKVALSTKAQNRERAEATPVHPGSVQRAPYFIRVNFQKLQASSRLPPPDRVEEPTVHSIKRRDSFKSARLPVR